MIFVHFICHAFLTHFLLSYPLTLAIMAHLHVLDDYDGITRCVGSIVCLIVPNAVRTTDGYSSMYGGGLVTDSESVRRATGVA